jgi:DNA (cytosine-5)-methyltransferase 1
MGFDSKESARITIPVSDTQAYRQFGNSVVVPVVESIARYMVPRMLRPDRYGPDQLNMPFGSTAA